MSPAVPGSKAAIEARQTVPDAIGVLPQNIPECLKELPQWVCWQFERREGKWTKPLICPRLGRGLAAVDRPATWGTFQEAFDFFFEEGLPGIGFVFTLDDPFCGVDFDDAVDPATGELKPWALEQVDILNSYSELSPTGTGVKVILRGRKPGARCRRPFADGKIEIYDDERYFTVTGQTFLGGTTEPEERQEQLDSLYHLLWPSVAPAVPYRPTVTTIGDQELIQKARQAGSGAGPKFRALWDGDISGYQSPSEADLALTNYLAFWTGGDAGRMDSLFRASGIMRPKWDREDYRRRTIATALDGRGENDYYRPGSNGNGRQHAMPAVESNGQADGSEARIIVRASEIIPTDVQELWPGRIYKGKLTTFAGQTCQGKTFVAVDIIARITQNYPWPDSNEPCGLEGQVLYITGDDGVEDTLVPRFIEAGANLERVIFLTKPAQAQWTMASLETLDIAIAQSGPIALVVIDPPTSFMDGIDDHRNSEVRALLTPFSEWAERNNVAVVFITHVNKGSSGQVDAMMRVMGSVAWCTGVRCAYIFLPNPDVPGQQLFLCLKNNLGPKAKGMAYRIVPGVKVGKVEWQGQVEIEADDAIRSKGPTPRSVVASEWLVERFREKLEWPSKELLALGKSSGVSRDAIFEAKDELDLPRARKVSRPGQSDQWVWWVPADWPGFALAPETETPATIAPDVVVTSESEIQE